MANRTDSSAISVHGTNPQYLIEKIVRLKIHGSQYWKEHCYALTAETLVDKAVELEYIGGTYGGSRKPAPFLCLVLKMLQLQPELEIVYEFITNTDYKYVRALGCFYLRLIGRPEDIYTRLEPLYNDYRKLRFRETDGKYKLIHVDEFVDELLLQEAVCDTVMPRFTKRQVLEENGTLQPRQSTLEEMEEDDEALLAEITENGNANKMGLAAGADELIENPRAEALRPDRRSEEKDRNGDRKKRRDEDEEDEEERRRRKEKKRDKKEKKKTKYRTRGSVSRSKSKSEKSSEGESRSRSRSRSEKKKKKKSKSKWKKELKEKRKDKHRDKSQDRSRSRSRSEKRNKRKGSEENNNNNNTKLNENSDEYWMAMRVKAGLKPV
jgi:pre-mRNA-splicing factor 38A